MTHYATTTNKCYASLTAAINAAIDAAIADTDTTPAADVELNLADTPAPGRELDVATIDAPAP